MPGERDGGDPACWLDRVCPECGRFIERPDDHDQNCQLGGRTSTATVHRPRSR